VNSVWFAQKGVDGGGLVLGPGGVLGAAVVPEQAHTRMLSQHPAQLCSAAEC
jgi:hypothetical protein